MTYILTEHRLLDRQTEEYELITRQVTSLETALYYVLDRFEEEMSRPLSAKDAYQPYIDFVQSTKPKLYSGSLKVSEVVPDKIDTDLFETTGDVDAYLLVSPIEIEAHFDDDFQIFVKDLDYIDPL